MPQTSKKVTTISEVMERAFRWPVIEPVQRVKELHHVPRGQRHLPARPRYIWHTYPIRGGITGTKLAIENMQSHNTLLRKLIGK